MASTIKVKDLTLTREEAAKLAEEILTKLAKYHGQRGYQLRHVSGKRQGVGTLRAHPTDPTAVKLHDHTLAIGGTLGECGARVGYYIAPVMYDPETNEVLREGWE